MQAMRTPIPTWYFSLCVVRRGERFLAIQERKHGQRWFLPGGRAEPGESLQQAARREALEEAGIPVRLLGLIRIEHTAGPSGARVRAIFLAEPLDDAEPGPTEDSLDARFVTLDELDALPGRGNAWRGYIHYVAAGGAVMPLSALSAEGAPLKAGHA